MSLKITKASDPIEVKQITVCLYGGPGLGKSSTGFTADKPLLLDFDGGAYRSGFRQDTVQIGSWDDVASITPDDLAPYSTVIVDTAGRALDCLTVEIIKKNAKLRGFGGALSLQGYGVLKVAFIAWLKSLHACGKDVVLIAHSDEQRNGDEIITRLDVQGGSKGEIYKSADAMAQLYFADGKRLLNFSPTDVAFGKNPAQLPVLTVPDFAKEPQFLAGIVADIKAKLNEQSEASKAEQSKLADWRETFGQLKTLDEFNAQIPKVANETPKVKSLLVAAGEKAGHTWDKKAKVFIATQQAAA